MWNTVVKGQRLKKNILTFKVLTFTLQAYNRKQRHDKNFNKYFHEIFCSISSHEPNKQNCNIY